MIASCAWYNKLNRSSDRSARMVLPVPRDHSKTKETTRITCPLHSIHSTLRTSRIQPRSSPRNSVAVSENNLSGFGKFLPAQTSMRCRLRTNPNQPTATSFLHQIIRMEYQQAPGGRACYNCMFSSVLSSLRPTSRLVFCNGCPLYAGRLSRRNWSSFVSTLLQAAQTL